MPEIDRFQHFLDAQNPVFSRVLEELTASRKQRHWMWFIFPQLGGLGNSTMNRRFALATIQQARDYYQHPVLGTRLLNCCKILLAGRHDDAVAIFGTTDACKLRSSMTLFHLAAPECTEFLSVLDKFFSGQADPFTLKLIDSP